MIDRRGFAKAGLGLLGSSLILRPGFAAAQQATPSHGLSMYGDLKYPPDFTHFDYVDPTAPKGGSLVLSAIGTTFDTLNPFVLRGVPAAGVALVYETIVESALDEPFTEYGLLAKTIATPDDRSFVEYELRENARWHDGRPVTAEDVIFSFETLRTRGAPVFRVYYADVAKAEKVGEGKVRFVFSGPMNRELPLIMGQLPILPAHWWEGRDFEAPSLEPPLGSGPYRAARVEPGRSITYERVVDWWGADIPVAKGRYNYGQIRYDYYRDANIAFEAFKAGAFDWQVESSAQKWATGYTGPAVEKGLIIKEEIRRESGGVIQGYWFNQRRDFFKDKRVREAIGYAFDFEWANRTLFYDQYTRCNSYFSGSNVFAATGLPQGPELALLEPFRDQLPPELFTEAFKLPVTDGSGNNREQLRTALALLKSAGWEVQDRRMVEVATGRPMQFEILLDNPLFERITGPFVKSLERLGIGARIRTVDSAQYQNRVTEFDFDMIVEIFGQSLSPGNEQREYWGSKPAAQPGSRNYAGIADPVVDAMIDKVIYAASREELETACRAMDRVLLWGHHVVPHWYSGYDRLARWDKFGRPSVMPRYGIDQYAWWINEAREQQVDQAKTSLKSG
ncbi:MAG TPA: extracellular solute-binding protein [Geminicoccus sp.]|jgi:microcin C transport system substrate-binding protein|uniref:extracellular solute-binding protein n=1 Tax=Geminicoccus sp. TaxID=2024832 RepID=UPI002E32CA3A|nr:extracellular solute-binding protein [Geminicoccus sp.]HEX2529385.1 extracellular solute-binding protein [Geminicoccus sp.]